MDFHRSRKQSSCQVGAFWGGVALVCIKIVATRRIVVGDRGGAAVSTSTAAPRGLVNRSREVSGPS